MHEYGRELYGEGELKAAPGCYCLLVRYATLCNPHQPHQPPIPCVHGNTQRWLFLQAEMCALRPRFEYYSNENQMAQIVQRRRRQCWLKHKWSTDGVCFLLCGGRVEISLSSSPSAVLLLHMSTRRQRYCERWLRQSFGCPVAQQMLAGKLGSSKTTGLPPLMRT